MDIVDFPNYLIYDDGRVYSKEKNKYMKHLLDSNYYRIGLNKNRKQKKFLIHRLVAIHYIPNPNNYPEVDHIDGNKINNHVSNLRWCSRSQNNQNKGVSKNNRLGIKNIRRTQDNGYRFQKKYNGKCHTKQFKTLEEAIQYKDVFYSTLDREFCKK